MVYSVLRSRSLYDWLLRQLFAALYKTSSCAGGWRQPQDSVRELLPSAFIHSHFSTLSHHKETHVAQLPAARHAAGLTASPLGTLLCGDASLQASGQRLSTTSRHWKLCPCSLSPLPCHAHSECASQSRLRLVFCQLRQVPDSSPSGHTYPTCCSQEAVVDISRVLLTRSHKFCCLLIQSNWLQINSKTSGTLSQKKQGPSCACSNIPVGLWKGLQSQIQSRQCKATGGRSWWKPSLLALWRLWWYEIQTSVAEQLPGLPQPLPDTFLGEKWEQGTRQNGSPGRNTSILVTFNPFLQKSGGGQRGMDFKWLCKRSPDESKSATTEKIQST